MLELFFGFAISVISFWIGHEVSEMRNQRTIINLKKELEELRDIIKRARPWAQPEAPK